MGKICGAEAWSSRRRVYYGSQMVLTIVMYIEVMHNEEATSLEVWTYV
jgi:hypothetical protein